MPDFIDPDLQILKERYVGKQIMVTMPNFVDVYSEAPRQLMNCMVFKIKDVTVIGSVYTRTYKYMIELPGGQVVSMDRRAFTMLSDVGISEETDEELAAQPCYQTAPFKVGDFVLEADRSHAYRVNSIDGALVYVANNDNGRFTRPFRYDRLIFLANSEKPGNCVFTGIPLEPDDLQLSNVVYSVANGTEYAIGFACRVAATAQVRCFECERLIYNPDEMQTVYETTYDADEHHDVARKLGAICPSCRQTGNYQRCDDCGRLFPNYSRVDTYNGDTLCEVCLEEHDYEECCECGRMVLDGAGHTRNVCGEPQTYCPDCWENFSFVHEYGYTPELNFLSQPGEITELYMGVELEIDGSTRVDECSEALDELGKDETLFCMTHDGSLRATGNSDNGIEITTQPATFKYHMTRFPWEEICSTAIHYGYRSHDPATCGLHVHVSREGLGDDNEERELTIAKLLLIFDTCWDQIVKFSRRTPAQLHWADKPDCEFEKEDTEEEVMEKKENFEYRRERYYAVNLCNDETVEFRIFRGSLKYNTIMATLQFVHNVIDYAMSHSIREVQNVTFSDLINQNSYDELNAYVVERGL